ncbi:response regulator [Pseudoxanthomonas gei]|uniref:Response regulator n=1 Tax=Pseudoxanthomonas gei TaxID=1383030 RepID=A0ABX0AFP7_9GAMM|nr:response regulator [Pseudoxanthomonas gei]NDK38985.1 response regulator [Pseudoxanthomonas gei]
MIPEDPARARRPAKQRRILVAEDNAMNQKLILRQLTLLGFDADIAADGCEALASWQGGHYGLLLCDLHMPRMDGFELAMAIRAAEQIHSGQGLRTPIIALTASAPREESDRCIAAGMDGYLGKPLQLAELKALLQDWLPDVADTLPALSADAWPARDDASVDVSVLQALIGPDPETNRKLQRQFQASAAEIASKLGRYCLGGESRLASEQAHKLCSAARAVGALALGALCAELETAGKENDAAALARLWILFERELQAVNSFLDTLPRPPPEGSRNDGAAAGSIGVGS